MKNKHLILLAAAAGLFVLGALIAVSTRETANLAAFPRQALFPALAQEMENIAKISLDTAQGNITVVRDSRGGWNFPDRGGWPANFDTVRKTVLALTKLTAIEKRTALPENHVALLLLAPDAKEAGAAGKGFRITAASADGKVLAALILGKVQTPPGNGKPGTAYVRRDGEDQTYLAEGDVNIPLLAPDWIDRMLFDVAADRIQSVTITPPSGPAYEITRANPKAEFTIGAIPRGKQLVLADLPANIAKAVSLLPLDDAMPADRIDFTGAFRADHKLFDGMVLTSWTVLRDNNRWTRFEAGFDPAQAERAAGMIGENAALLKPDQVQKMIAEITARTKGWAFKLPGMKAADLTRDYYSLFKTPGPAEKTDEHQPEMDMVE